MQPMMRSYVGGTAAALAVLAAGLILDAPSGRVRAASGTMPAAQQNELVAKYCAVCHKDADRQGGLSLEKFDATDLDPSLAAMMVSKLKGKAMGASGAPLPDRATQDAFLAALAEESAGASAWTVKTQAPLLTAAIVKEMPSRANGGEPDMYRLTLTCRADTREGEIQVSWAPGDVPGTGATLSASVDGRTAVKYRVENGEGASKLVMPLPEKTLAVSSLFTKETVVFPFGGLAESARQGLSLCFTGSSSQ